MMDTSKTKLASAKLGLGVGRGLVPTRVTTGYEEEAESERLAIPGLEERENGEVGGIHIASCERDLGREVLEGG